MLDVGRLCIKIAGKDAGKMVVVVDKVDATFVLIDGPIKRKRCNINHLEPLGQELKIKKGASRVEIVKEFKKLGVDIKDTKRKEKKSEKPTRKREEKVKKEKVKKVPKVEVEKAAKKTKEEAKKSGK